MRPRPTICLACHPAWPFISWTLPLHCLRPLLVKRGDSSLAIGFVDSQHLSEPYPLTCTDSSPRNTMAPDIGATVPPRQSPFPNLAYIPTLTAREARTGFSKDVVRAPPQVSVTMTPLCSLRGFRREDPEIMLPRMPNSCLRRVPPRKCTSLRLA